MNRRRFLLLILSVLVMPLSLFLFSGCDQTETGPENANAFEQLQHKTVAKRIAASSYPLVAMAQSIVGEGYEVWMPEKANKVPTAGEIRKLQSSDVLLTNGPGATYAMWLPMVTLDRQKIFETTKDSFELADYIQVHEHQIVHSHGGEGEHSHAWMVPHCWLNPRLALLQGQEICDKLCELYPGDADSFSANYKLFESSVQEAVEAAADCRKLLKTKKMFLLLSDPRLKHLGRAIGPDVDYLLWFEQEEMRVAKRQLQEKIAARGEGQKANGQPLLLWARAPGPKERELMSAVKWIELDLIESPDAEKEFATRLKNNFKLLADGIEMATEGGNGFE